MKKIRISQLPLCSSLKGLFTLGTDKDNRSVKVSLEFIEEETGKAVGNAEAAAEAARTATENADKATENAKTATDRADKATTEAAAAEAAGAAGDAAAAAREAKENADVAAGNAANAATEAETAAKAAKAATEAADAAAGKANQAAEGALEAADNVLLALGKIVPAGMTVESVSRLTTGNVRPNYIKCTLSPAGAMNNVIYLCDNKAITVGTDGRITIVGTGKSTVHVIPTCNAALAKNLLIEVAAPALRKASRKSLRLTLSEALRLG